MPRSGAEEKPEGKNCCIVLGGTETSQLLSSQVAEKEREARRMREEAVRVGNHADKLKRDRARSLQEIESKLRLVISV